MWDSWDRKDSESHITGASTFDPSVVSQQQKEEYLERRSRSHEKLLMHAYIAMSKPPPELMREKGEEWHNNGQLQLDQKQTIGQYSGFHQQQTISDGPYFSDAENMIPKSFENQNGLQARPMTSYSNALQNRPMTSHSNVPQARPMTSHFNAPQTRPMTSHTPQMNQKPVEQEGKSFSEKTKDSSVSSVKSNPSLRQTKSIAYQKHVLEKFCVRIKHMAVEVLKLNREKKWQTRYLTVSKEGTWLKSSAKSDACFCPLGLLWVKKFSKSREYSVLTIDKQGRGGVLLANLVQVNVSEDKNGNSALTKTQMKKFHDSCIVSIQGKSSFVTLRCERNDADAILIGCNAIIDVLRGSRSSEGSTSGSVMMKSQSGSSRMSGTKSVGSQMTSKRSLVNTLVANDLWEA